MPQSKYLPKPPNYGFINADFQKPIRTVQPRPIQLHDTDWLDGLMSQAAPNIEMPDIVKVHWGASDPDIVGQMYRILGDKESNLVGVSKDIVRQYLDKWGYPEDPATWTADQFNAEFQKRALDMNPVAILGGQ